MGTIHIATCIPQLFHFTMNSPPAAAKALYLKA
uniref:Uncharacterized protein n=1 Tax=Anguilla anguilla TaxID=7936 RepID=A0A0E9PSB2_ANGAN